MSQAEANARRASAAASIDNTWGNITINGNAFLGSQVSGPVDQHPNVRPLHKRFIASLAVSDDNLREEQISDAFQGTFKWIFEQSPDQHWPSFRKWLEEDDALYWISGKPGAGKSTLMKFIVQHPSLPRHLEAWAPKQRITIVRHYFFRAAYLAQRTLDGCLKNLIRQIIDANPAAFSCVQPFLTSRSKQSSPLRVDELQGMLATLVRDSQQHFCFLIDGVDEFQDNDYSLSRLTSMLTHIANEPNVKMCVASRPEFHLFNTFSGYKHLEVHNLTKEDMFTTANEQLSALDQFHALFGGDTTKMEQFVRDLCAQSEGIFLWLRIAMKQLVDGICKGDSLAILKERLDTMGGSLDDMFNTLLKRLEPIYYKSAAAMIQTCKLDVAFPAHYIATRYPSMLFAALQKSPGSKRPFVEITLPSLDADAETIDEIFRQSRHQAHVLPDRVAWFLEAIGQDTCTAGSAAECNCSLVSSLELNHASALIASPLFSLISHLALQRLAFIHRSAHDFFDDHEDAKNFLWENCPPNAEFGTELSQTWIRASKVVLTGLLALIRTLYERNELQELPEFPTNSLNPAPFDTMFNLYRSQFNTIYGLAAMAFNDPRVDAKTKRRLFIERAADLCSIEDLSDDITSAVAALRHMSSSPNFESDNPNEKHREFALVIHGLEAFQHAAKSPRRAQSFYWRVLRSQHPWFKRLLVIEPNTALGSMLYLSRYSAGGVGLPGRSTYDLNMFELLTEWTRFQTRFRRDFILAPHGPF